LAEKTPDPLSRKMMTKEGRRTGVHHYITQYTENGVRYAEAWLQINIFGRAFCFSRRKKAIR
jgi:hypothetical protein